METPHDRPSSDELLESVREWLERDVMTSSDSRIAFHARVAANIIEIVRRENAAADHVNARHHDVMSQLDVTSTDELAMKIRNGDFDERLGELVRILRPTIEDKVSVANPRYMNG
jgi:hypothetical protein